MKPTMKNHKRRKGGINSYNLYAENLSLLEGLDGLSSLSEEMRTTQLKRVAENIAGTAVVFQFRTTWFSRPYVFMHH